MNDIDIGGIKIGNQHKPFIIAEMSGNHNQSLDRALEIVDAAATSGAHAIKLQTYTADTMTIKGAYTIEDPKSPWHQRELYELYEEAHTPWEWHEPIFKRAAERGIIAFSSAFDKTSIALLETLEAPAYKIASFENTDWSLLRKIAETGKPVLMSTGVIGLADLEESVSVLREAGCKELILLKCTSSYPASRTDCNLHTIPDMAKKFNCHVGLSDHTTGPGASIGAITLGAKVIEKHFTLNRADGGVDASFSMEPDELMQLVIESELAFNSLGQIQYEVQEAEQKSLNFKRSIYVSKDIEEGEPITKDNIRIIRPGLGLQPKFFEEVLGKKANRQIPAGTPLSFELLTGQS